MVGEGVCDAFSRCGLQGLAGTNRRICLTPRQPTLCRDVVRANYAPCKYALMQTCARCMARTRRAPSRGLRLCDELVCVCYLLYYTLNRRLRRRPGSYWGTNSDIRCLAVAIRCICRHKPSNTRAISDARQLCKIGRERRSVALEPNCFKQRDKLFGSKQR